MQKFKVVAQIQVQKLIVVAEMQKFSKLHLVFWEV